MMAVALEKHLLSEAMSKMVCVFRHRCDRAMAVSLFEGNFIVMTYDNNCAGKCLSDSAIDERADGGEVWGLGGFRLSADIAVVKLEYFTDQKTATTVYLAGQINKPIMLEGPAGAGKTELAQSVARAAGADLLRLQCYQGINEEKAIGQFDKSLQELFVLLKTKTEGAYDWDQIRRDVTSRAFFLAGPLLTVIEQGEALCSPDRRN